MPTIKCPGCGKKYSVPATAAGQVAKCACGKKFKLAGGPPSSVPAAAAKPKAAAVVSKAKPVTVAASPTKKSAVATVDDDFWDDALREEQTAKVVEMARPVPAPEPLAIAAPPTAKPGEAAPKKKRNKFRGIRWGFDWGKVVCGLAAFLIFGGITVAIVMSTGRISRGTMYLAVPAIAGLFTAINGLMGEEGIW
jgi:hypothetical protein